LELLAFQKRIWNVQNPKSPKPLNSKTPLMDKLSQTTRAQWNALAEANVMHAIPFLDYTLEQAKAYAYRHGIITEVNNKQVFCLASGGGKCLDTINLHFL
jgi:hypothetical protein